VWAGPQSLWEVEKKRQGMADANLTTLNSFGEPLMDAVCKNACSGHDVTKVRGEGLGRERYSIVGNR